MEQQLIEQFKTFYADLTGVEIATLHQFYSDSIIFRDPVHEIHGLVLLEDYMCQLCENLTRGHFEYLDQLSTDKAAYIKWLMHFEHPKLGSKPITVRGASHIQFDQRIYFHEDFYDMGAMLYEHVPLIGGATRWLKTRLGQR